MHASNTLVDDGKLTFDPVTGRMITKTCGCSQYDSMGRMIYTCQHSRCKCGNRAEIWTSLGIYCKQCYDGLFK